MSLMCLQKDQVRRDPCEPRDENKRTGYREYWVTSVPARCSGNGYALVTKCPLEYLSVFPARFGDFGDGNIDHSRSSVRVLGDSNERNIEMLTEEER